MKTGLNTEGDDGGNKDEDQETDIADTARDRQLKGGREWKDGSSGELRT